MVWCPLSTKGQGVLDDGGGKLVGENFMVGQIFEELVKEKGFAPWIKEGTWNLLAQIVSCGMNYKHSKCVPIVRWRQLGWLWCGVQGVNRKIRSHPKHDQIDKEDIENGQQAKNT